MFFEINCFLEICLFDINGGNNVLGIICEKLIDDRLIFVYRLFIILWVFGGFLVLLDDDDEESDEESLLEEGKVKVEELEVDKVFINRR